MITACSVADNMMPNSDDFGRRKDMAFRFHFVALPPEAEAQYVCWWEKSGLMLLSCFTLEILSKCRETIVRCDEGLYDSSVFQKEKMALAGVTLFAAYVYQDYLVFLFLFSGADIILTARPQVSLHAAFASGIRKKWFLIFWNFQDFCCRSNEARK